jgi:hypothetical protein
MQEWLWDRRNLCGRRWFGLNPDTDVASPTGLKSADSSGGLRRP